MLAQVTCFTIAHTSTLILSLFGLLALPDRIIEPLIALSIIYVGIENIVTDKLKKWRLILVFLFGLLHGLGFTGALFHIGIPEGYFIESLIAFNLGIELAHIFVVGLAYFILFSFFKKKSAYRKYIAIPGSIIISTIGSWMLYDRIIF
jgi:hypothetical protein